MLPNTCCFFVGSLEDSFVLSELFSLSRKFQKVYVFYYQQKDKQVLPDNIVLVKLESAIKSKFSLLGLWLCASILIKDLLSQGTSFKYIKQARYNFSLIRKNYTYAKEIAGYLDESRIEFSSFFYSFWFDEMATILAFLKRNGNIKYYFTRAHGRDLFEEREPLTKKLYHRSFQLKYVDHVFSVSKVGYEYLCEKYPLYVAKFAYNYLGTHDGGKNPSSETEEIVIASCAFVRNIKRIYLIPQILPLIGRKIKWVHIGNLNDKSKNPTEVLFREEVKKLKDNANIQVSLLGHMSNEQIFEFYQTNHIDIFLSVSETEGLPVSMMEASSFGIPTVCTNVGGCKELIVDQRQLVPKDFQMNEIVSSIQYVIENKSLREKSRLKWEKSFNLEKNFNSFLDVIKEAIK